MSCTKYLAALAVLSACLPLLAGADDTAPPACKKLIVVGDSITKHLPAAEKLGWYGYWGMAASSEDKDYVHLIHARMTAAQNGQAPQLLIEGGGGAQLADKSQILDEIKAYGADVAILQIGENDANPTEDSFEKPYETILKTFRDGNPDVRIFCFGVWSPPNGDSAKDQMIIEACDHKKATFIDMSLANADSSNKTESENRFTNVGVNWHPGDRGMQAYADAFWLAYTGKAATPPDATPTAVSPSSGAIITETWERTSGIDWSPKPPLDTVDGHASLTATLSKPNDRSFFSTYLPIEKIKGHTVQITTRVKGTNISEKPHPWNGVRVGLTLLNAEGKKDYPQTTLPVGTFDWTDVTWKFDVPSNVVIAQFVLGLEAVTGTVNFDKVKIEVLP